MAILAAALSGLLFGAGLVLSGMANPAKVLNFLDVFGSWDPSLALVMGGALMVTIPVFQWARRRGTTLLSMPLQLPSRSDIDRPLLIGAVTFGIGWGLVGLCPGPAVVGLVSLQGESVLFLAAMLAGIVLGGRLPLRS